MHDSYIACHPVTPSGATIGALAPDAWAGIVLCPEAGSGFGIRFAVERDGTRADGGDLFFLAHEVGPHAPDGSYARVAFDVDLPLGLGNDTPKVPAAERRAGLTVEWARGGDAVDVRVQAAYEGVLEVRGYFPWDWTGHWRVAPGVLHAETEGGSHRLEVLVVVPESAPDAEWAIEAGAAVARIAVTSGDCIYVRAAIGDDPPSAETQAIDAHLSQALAAYESKRPVVTGEWAGLVASIANNLHWMIALQPETGRLYTPAGRRWIFPAHAADATDQHWTIFCWDSFLNALQLAVESPDLARAVLRSVLHTQYNNGNVPNWRGRFNGTPDRSQPPIGSFAVLKYFLRTGDRELVVRALPFLERWSAWWTAPKGRGRRRSGGPHALFQWGSDLDLVIDSPAEWENSSSHQQKAAWESGQDDLPNWDDAEWCAETETLDLDAVDLCSYLALDSECLAELATILGETNRAQAYRDRRALLIQKMNVHFWCEDAGMYLDRRWSGEWSRRMAASNFLPLLAGVPDDAQAARMIETLRDESKFGGSFVLPSISRDDPAFPDQQYWRGTIWPPMNYLVYQGLRRYGFDVDAGQMAARSVAMFLGDWRRFGYCRENFHGDTGEGGGHRFQSWGPLFALIGVEEFVDVTPWEGLRVGTLTPPAATTLRRLVIRDRSWDVTLSPEGVAVECDGQRMFTTTGPATFRHLERSDQALRATVTCATSVTLCVEGFGPTARVEIDGTIETRSTADIDLPAGQRLVRVEAIPEP